MFLGRAFVVTWLLTLAPLVTAAQDNGAKTIWDGVFTVEQAQRGRETYRKACVYCHRVDLKGASDSGAPGLVGPSFLTRWSGKPLSDLFAYVATNMPKDGTEWGGDPPVDMSLEQHLDVVAYILAGNQCRPGEHELPADDALRHILITRLKP